MLQTFQNDIKKEKKKKSFIMSGGKMSVGAQCYFLALFKGRMAQCLIFLKWRNEEMANHFGAAQYCGCLI